MKNNFVKELMLGGGRGFGPLMVIQMSTEKSRMKEINSIWSHTMAGTFHVCVCVCACLCVCVCVHIEVSIAHTPKPHCT